MANQNNTQGQDVNQLLKVRREKLAALQEAGKDPFQITKYDVTHHTSDVREIYTAHEEELLAIGRRRMWKDWTRNRQRRFSSRIMRSEEASWMPVRLPCPSQVV